MVSVPVELKKVSTEIFMNELRSQHLKFVSGEKSSNFECLTKLKQTGLASVLLGRKLLIGGEQLEVTFTVSTLISPQETKFLSHRHRSHICWEKTFGGIFGWLGHWGNQAGRLWEKADAPWRYLSYWREGAVRVCVCMCVCVGVCVCVRVWDRKREREGERNSKRSSVLFNWGEKWLLTGWITTRWTFNQASLCLAPRHPMP